MRFAVYSRKSKFTGKGESIENQIEMCREYIGKHFGDTDEQDITVFEDEGFSGKNLERPEFQKMMRAAEKNLFDCIICYRLDRISRSISDFSSLIENLNSRKISFICIKEQFDTSNPMGRAMMYIASVFAQLERETIAERVRDNMALLARTGRWLGGPPPTGFATEKTEDFIMDGKSKISCKLKWNPTEIETVKIIFSKFLDLQSISGVGKYLIEKNIKSRGGKFFSLPGIKDILSNPVYCVADEDARTYFLQKGSDVCFDERDCSDQFGLLSYNKRDYSRRQSSRLDESEWIIAKGKHRGLVRGAAWVMIQRKLSENKISDRERVKTHNEYALFSGLIFCTKCRERMFAKQRSGNGNLFDYICFSKMRGGKKLCDCCNLNGSRTDDDICRYLLDYMKESAGIYQLFERLKSKIREEGGRSPLVTTEEAIARLEREISGYLSACAKPGLSDSFIRGLNAKVMELDERLLKLRRKKEELLTSQESALRDEFRLDAISRGLSHFRDNFKNLTIYERRELIRFLVDRIEWDGEDLHIFIFE